MKLDSSHQYPSKNDVRIVEFIKVLSIRISPNFSSEISRAFVIAEYGNHIFDLEIE